MSRKKFIQAHYEPRITPGRSNHEVLDWSDAKSQNARFKVLAANVELSGRSLLDVGCGLGDLWAFCRSCGIDADYTGVDILEKMVNAARQKHPGGRFIHADVFGPNPPAPDSYDVVFCSGVFNLNLGNNRDFLPKALIRLLEISRQALVVNLLHQRTVSRHDHCFYYDPREVREILKTLPCESTILEDYLPNDFTVICRKKPGRRHHSAK